MKYTFSLRVLDCFVLGCLAGTVSFGCSSKDKQADAGVSDVGATGGSSSFQLDGGNSDPDGSNQQCGGSKLKASPQPVNVVVLLDRSLSMNTALSATEPKTRWQAMREALNTALSGVQDRISFGLKLFPDSAAECSVTKPGLAVEVGLGASAVASIDQAIGAATPAGGTPVASALAQLLDYYASVDAGTLVGDKVVLLATDGAPNCNSGQTCEQSACIANIENPSQPQNICQFDPAQCLDTTETVAKVKALYDEGIRTVVLGIPGTEYPQYQGVLNQMAAAGGLANQDPGYDYYPVSADAGLQGLKTTLETITKGLIKSCRLQLTSVPHELGLLNVQVDGREIPQSGADGWEIDQSTSPPTVVLKGTTCQSIETQGAESVDVVYGCPTVIF
jgi:hypothetical protein